MTAKLPFKEKILDNNFVVREFSPDTSDDELVWHKDREHRILEVLEDTDWMFQLDNELPFNMVVKERITIPKDIYHRVIKGTTPLKIKIFKYE